MFHRGALLLTFSVSVAFAAGRLPFVFETNRGQAPAAVQMLGRQGGATLMLTGKEIWLQTPKAMLRTRFEGQRGKLLAEGLEASGGTTNYFLGKSAVRASHFARARYRDVYPGIDSVFYEKDGRLEYDLVVAPDANPNQISLSFPGADKVHVDAAGDLVIQVGGESFRQSRPVAYQLIAGKRVEAEASFSVANGRVGFHLGRYDSKESLVIDPTIVYAGFFGGEGQDSAYMGIDSAGNMYLAGTTSSTNLPVTAGGRPKPTNSENCYVAKLNPSGTSILYVTYLGGSLPSRVEAMAVDAGGNVYVTGDTHAPDFPVTPGAAQGSHRSANSTSPTDRDDAYVTKLSPSGTLVYSTYLGGERADGALAIAIDGSGNAYIGGLTRSRNFVITPGAAQINYGGNNFDGFVAKLNASGSAFVYGTYLGGTSDEHVRAIAVDSLGGLSIVGDGFPRSFPVTPGAFQTAPKAFNECFFVRLNPAGTSWTYSTLIGGGGTDVVRDVTHDASGAVYIVGETDSTDFVTTPGAYQRSIRGEGSYDAFVMKFSAANVLVYSTLLGGGEFDVADRVRVDRNGNAFVTGGTASADFPAALPRQFFGGNIDVFLTRLNATGSAILDSTFLGRSQSEGATSLEIDGSDAVYVGGSTRSVDFPLSASAAQATFRGGLTDGFYIKYSYAAPAPPVALQAMVNAASFIGGPIAPGEIVTLFGSPIGPANLTTLQLENGSVSTLLAATRVRFDDVDAPIIYASTGQTSVVVPYSVAGKSVVEVVVEYQGGRSQQVQAIIAPAKPAIFTATSNGQGQGAILNQDGSVNSKANPAAAQSVVVLYGTGGGLVTPRAVTGGITAGIANQDVPITVEFGTGTGRRAGEVLYSGSAPGLVNGVLQVNVKLPAGVSGTVPLRVRSGAETSPDVTVEVRAN